MVWIIVWCNRSLTYFFQMFQQHKGADSMIRLLKIYEEEDEAYMELVTVATLFYQYLLQPFRDMRELAMLYKMEILVQFALLGFKAWAFWQITVVKWFNYKGLQFRFVYILLLHYDIIFFRGFLLHHLFCS